MVTSSICGAVELSLFAVYCCLSKEMSHGDEADICSILFATK